MAVACFTYGTLMCEEIMSTGAGSRFASTPASLAGYSRHPVAGEPYPGIRHNPDQSVDGVLYLDVNAISLERLDAFEGDEYSRETVKVQLPDGALIIAQVYVFKHTELHRLKAGDWDFEAFLRRDRHGFGARYPGFSRA